MRKDEPLVADIERMETMIAPSLTTVRTTFAALNRTVDTIRSDCRVIAETLQALDDALRAISQASGVGSEWAGFGMISLPIMGALHAAKSIAGQYVKQQTGVPLNAWTDLVAGALAQFGDYLAALDTVARLTERHHAPATTEIDLEQVRADEQILEEARWRTHAWKQALSRVAQLGQLVDAILQANLRGDHALSAVSEPERTGLSGTLQKRLKEAQTRATERTGDLHEWVLQPFVEVRDRVRELPGQTKQLSHEVALLEVLLDLEIAEIRACAGDISATEARIVGMRVAANVVLPELGQRLAAARQRVTALETYLDRIGRAHEAGQVDDRAYGLLAEEYRTALASSRSGLAELEAEADLWRRDGKAVLDACADWTTLEMDVLDARRLAEQVEPPGDRRVLLQRERDRLTEARSVLAQL